MRRVFAFALSFVIFSSGILLAQCTPLRDNNCIAPIARGTCTVSAQWFADNNDVDCPNHRAILISQGGHLSLGNGLPFEVKQFKQFPYFPGTTQCDFNPNDQIDPPANPMPFKDLAGLSTVLYVHNLTANSGSDGCYEVNLIVSNNDGTKTPIDPHIIVSGNNLVNRSKHHGGERSDATPKPKSN
jgi:hypothetical protein